MRSSYALTLLATVFFSTSTEARTLFVSLDGDGTVGESWETAFTAIGDAVVIAVTGDEVWVRHGTYNEAIFLATPILIMGGFQGDEGVRRETVENETVMIPEGLTVPAVQIASAVTIDGFTLRDGERAGMTIHSDALAIVRNCRFKNNVGRLPQGGFGGGVVVFGVEAHFLKCTFTNNRALDSGGGIEITREIGTPVGSDVTMENCFIAGNRGRSGAGVSCIDSDLRMRSCVINGNTVPDSSGGGGLSIGGSGVTMVENCLIYENSGGETGEQVSLGLEDVPVVFDSCTIIGGEGEILWGTLPPVFRNCILWGSTSLIGGGLGSEDDPDVSYTCIQGGHEGIGNIMDDPLFIDEVGNDYHLQPASPCLDTADTEGPSDDLDGNPRPRDLFGVGRDGPGAFDMGAYEFQPPSADLNGDGETNMLDLLILDRQWYSVSGVR